eukprot:126028_1
MNSIPELSNAVKSESNCDVTMQNDAAVIKDESADAALYSQHEDSGDVLPNFSDNINSDIMLPVGFMSSQTTSLPADMPHLEGEFSCRSCHQSFRLKIDLVRHVTSTHSGQESELLRSGDTLKPGSSANH